MDKALHIIRIYAAKYKAKCTTLNYHNSKCKGPGKGKAQPKKKKQQKQAGLSKGQAPEPRQQRQVWEMWKGTHQQGQKCPAADQNC